MLKLSLKVRTSTTKTTHMNIQVKQLINNKFNLYGKHIKALYNNNHNCVPQPQIISFKMLFLKLAILYLKPLLFSLSLSKT